MSMSRIPPIASLRALEAAARHLSYTRAADELNVTQSAVSHQIKHAETLWGLKLFHRHGRRLVLTENGQVLVPIVREFLERITAAADELKAEGQRGSLRVTLIQSFAFKWLVPRLGHFNARYPDVEVWLSTSEDTVDLSRDEADVGIRLGYGNWPGLFSSLLLREYVFPVCSPYFLQSVKPPETPADLLRLPLLRRYSLDITPRWQDWFRAAGVNVRKMPRGTKFSDTSTALQAAIGGQGIALARSAHVSDDLAAGRLVKLFDVFCESNIAYYFVCARGNETKTSIGAFKRWLEEEASVAQREFDAVMGVEPAVTDKQ